jgi:hypothetical protein
MRILASRAGKVKSGLSNAGAALGSECYWDAAAGFSLSSQRICSSA